MDLQWADLRPEHSLAMRLAKAGRVTRLFTEKQVEEAADTPPTNTRAYGRGLAVARRKDLVKASWTSLVLDPGVGDLIRHPIADAASSGEL